MPLAIWWVRRDMRLSDNPALQAALRHGGVLPVFVMDPRLWTTTYAGEKRLAFLRGGLEALDTALHARGSYLVLLRGDPTEQLAHLVARSGAEAVYAEADTEPYARARDARVAQSVPLTLVGWPTAHPPDAVRRADGGAYQVYTPYRRAWAALPSPPPPLPAPHAIPTPPGWREGPIPPEPLLPPAVPFPPGEEEAQHRLRAFCAGPIAAYAQAREFIAEAGTSQLSPYLRFGMLSARQAIAAAYTAMEQPEARAGAEVWLGELIWREFYHAVLWHFPHVLEMSFRAELRAVPWRNAPEDFAAWTEGRTGYPVVDAAMRQLRESGWMHNRARMIVASFLTKDLLIAWQAGERYFMQHLLDAEPASNNGGWQWAAGTGTDAAPYFRIFNPVAQGQKFDPDGAYVRRWVPELRAVPTAYIHAPWRMPEEMQRKVGCRIGVDYPAPIVDHAMARARTLAAYRQSKSTLQEEEKHDLDTFS